MQAAELFEEKVKPSEIARRLRVSVKSAYHWHQLRRRTGRGSRSGSGQCRDGLRRRTGGCKGSAPFICSDDQIWSLAISRVHNPD